MALTCNLTSSATYKLPQKGKPKKISSCCNVFLGGSKRNATSNLRTFNRVTMVAAINVSTFNGVSMAPPDPILGVSELFGADPNQRKLNLGLGAYRTEELRPYVLNVVKKAEKHMLEKGENKEYSPVEGLADFNKVTGELLLGASNPIIEEQRIATVQSISGTGALRLGAALIERSFSGARLLMSSPTWGMRLPSHRIWLQCRISNFSYWQVYLSPFYDYCCLLAISDFWNSFRLWKHTVLPNVVMDFQAAPERSFVLLHGCAHNPTGIDPTPEQWQKIADVIQEKNHIPFFDVAYQGFASGSLDKDAAAIRMFVARGMEMLVAQSYSKNLGLYADRIGAINVICASADAVVRVKSQLKWLAVSMYAFPPIHGARIVANVVGNVELYREWKEEMKMMAGRITNVRQKLYDCLTSKDPNGMDWSFILKQIGMFSYTGLNKAQIENMTNKWHVYMTKGGRISLAGLPSARCEYLADAIIDTYHHNNNHRVSLPGQARPWELEKVSSLTSV